MEKTKLWRKNIIANFLLFGVKSIHLNRVDVSERDRESSSIFFLKLLEVMSDIEFFMNENQTPTDLINNIHNAHSKSRPFNRPFHFVSSSHVNSVESYDQELKEGIGIFEKTNSIFGSSTNMLDATFTFADLENKSRKALDSLPDYFMEGFPIFKDKKRASATSYLMWIITTSVGELYDNVEMRKLTGLIGNLCVLYHESDFFKPINAFERVLQKERWKEIVIDIMTDFNCQSQVEMIDMMFIDICKKVAKGSVHTDEIDFAKFQLTSSDMRVGIDYRGFDFLSGNIVNKTLFEYSCEQIEEALCAMLFMWHPSPECVELTDEIPPGIEWE